MPVGRPSGNTSFAGGRPINLNTGQQLLPGEAVPINPSEQHNLNLSGQAEQQSTDIQLGAQKALRDQLYGQGQAAFENKFSKFTSLLKPDTTTFGPGFGSGNGIQSVGSVPNVGDVDTSAAERASFARAKDQVGQTSSGALAGLRSALGGRGMLGSGSESRGAASVINKGQQELGDVSRTNATHSADLAQETAVQNQNAGVAQRGQTLNAIASENQLRVQQAQQLASTRQAALSSLYAALGGGNGAY